MINSISIHAPTTSYKETIEVTGLKKFNLFYGINGSGKTVLSQYLATYNNPDKKYNGSKLYYDTAPNIFVYNQDFVQKHFWNNNLTGIFTLGQTNVEAEKVIQQANEEITKLKGEDENNAYPKNKRSIQNQIKSLEDKQERLKKNLDKKLWECKLKYENTSFSPFMSGLMGSKDKFCDYIVDMEYQPIEQSLSTNERLQKLEKELKQLSSSNSARKEKISKIPDEITEYDSNPIFEKSIVGSNDSYLKELVEELNNEDWLIQGINNYLNKSQKCPFCTQPIEDKLREKLNSHIDSTYQSNVNQLLTLEQNYKTKKNEVETLLKSLKKTESLAKNNEFVALTEELETRLASNLSLITNKIKEPSQLVNLSNNTSLIDKINSIISSENNNIHIFNEKIANKEEAKAEIKNQFWDIIRETYNPDISSYIQQKKDIDKDIKLNQQEVTKISDQIKKQNKLITEKQKETKNIDEAIKKINQQLKDFGVDSFSIKKADEHNISEPLYVISRNKNSQDENVFHTLSEGEKTLITFLYFVEKTCGIEEQGISENINNRVIVIDDPISSLSFNYIFDIAVLIKDKYLNKSIIFDQVFVLTHHLYFLHELFGNTSDKLPGNFSLYRIIKGAHSTIHPISRSEIKNNYECYWQIIKDIKAGTANPIVLPNAMRNILEHYFSFIHAKHKLLEVINGLAASENDLSFKSFHRYIDRSSHSDAVNIVDSNDIDVDKYLKYFKKIFTNAGYAEHFDAMSNNGTYGLQD